jgi:pilus assembly protein Flp/PilA
LRQTLLPAVVLLPEVCLIFFQESSVMSKFIAALRNVTVREEGATMVEYGLMVALIAVVAVAAVGTLGGKVADTFSGLTF